MSSNVTSFSDLLQEDRPHKIKALLKKDIFHHFIPQCANFDMLAHNDPHREQFKNIIFEKIVEKKIALNAHAFDGYRYTLLLSDLFSRMSLEMFKKHEKFWKKNIHSPEVESCFFNTLAGVFVKEASTKGKLLLDWGLNPNVEYGPQHTGLSQHLGFSALEIAKSPVLVECLLQKGADYKHLPNPHKWIETVFEDFSKIKTINVLEIAKLEAIKNKKVHPFFFIGNDFDKKERLLTDKTKENPVAVLKVLREYDRRKNIVLNDAYSAAVAEKDTVKITAMRPFIPEEKISLKDQSEYEKFLHIKKTKKPNEAMTAIRALVEQHNKMLLDHIEDHVDLIPAPGTGKKNLLLTAIQTNNIELASRIMDLNILDKKSTGVSQETYIDFAIGKGLGSLAKLCLEKGYHNPQHSTASSVTGNALKKNLMGIAFELYKAGYPVNKSQTEAMEKISKKEQKIFKQMIQDKKAEKRLEKFLGRDVEIQHPPIRKIKNNVL